MDDKEIVKKPEGTTENNDDGSKPKATRLIDDANLAAKRMEEANKEKKELLDREEELMSQARLSGRSLAGGEAPKEKSADEKWAEDAKKRYEGTGMDPTD